MSTEEEKNVTETKAVEEKDSDVRNNRIEMRIK